MKKPKRLKVRYLNKMFSIVCVNCQYAHSWPARWAILKGEPSSTVRQWIGPTAAQDSIVKRMSIL